MDILQTRSSTVAERLRVLRVIKYFAKSKSLKVIRNDIVE